MRFASVRIQNLFSYQDGNFLFPLDAEEGRNVVLIHGRNGFGKTSFINAMKLVFLGPHSELTNNVRPPYKMGVDEYFLGSGPEWEGVFNRHARRDGKTTCSISLRWLEESGFVTITRSWDMDRRRGIIESLSIVPEFPIEDDELQTAEQKDAFIERRLPKALLPFFIYDAEQVQKIAEANMAGTIEQIERLLDVTTTRMAEDALTRVLKKIRATGNARFEQIKLDNLRNKLEAARIQNTQIEADIGEKERDINELKYRIRQLEEGVEQFRELSRRNEQEHRQAAENLKASREKLEGETFAFLDDFPVTAPFVAHPNLVRDALTQVEDLIHSGRSGLAQELKDILDRLPVRLFDEPQHPRPALEEGQTRFLKTKLFNLLQAEISLAASVQTPEAWQMDLERARRLTQSLRHLAGLEDRETIRRFKEIGRLKSDIRQAESTLSDVSSLPDEERRRIEERLAVPSRVIMCRKGVILCLLRGRH